MFSGFCWQLLQHHQKLASDEIVVFAESKVLVVPLLHLPALAVPLQVKDDRVSMCQVGHQEEDVRPSVLALRG